MGEVTKSWFGGRGNKGGGGYKKVTYNQKDGVTDILSRSPDNRGKWDSASSFGVSRLSRIPRIPGSPADGSTFTFSIPTGRDLVYK